MQSNPSVYDFEVATMSGEKVKLEKYRGKVIMLVNTASKCGFTKQLGELQQLFERYEKEGLIILAFPANNFMNQEPGTNEEIEKFYRTEFGVTFPIFAKLSVSGENQHPLYNFLTSKETNPHFKGRITWNFNKFLVSRDGEIINRFSSRTAPSSEKVVAAIEKAL